MKNVYCDRQDSSFYVGGACTEGEVRLLPLGKEPLHGNLILCKHHYEQELRYRVERNKDLSKEAQFELPKWEDAKVYET